MKRLGRNTEGDRIPVERPDFKSGEARLACLVGSTPTPFRPMKPLVPLFVPPSAAARPEKFS